MDDTARSLEELDGERWGEAPEDATGLVRECHRLRTVPIGQLSGEDVVTLLGQRIGATWLVPLALDQLGADPLAGDWYPGQLLDAVLRAGAGYWNEHPDETVRLWDVRESLERLRVQAEKLLSDDRWPAFG